MRVLALNGSPHKDGNVSYLLNYIGEGLKENLVDYKILNCGELLKSSKTPFCNCCSSPCNRSCFEGTALQLAFEEIEKADFLILASPVYFGTCSAQIKAFFDKTRDLRGKKALVGKFGAAVSVGASKYGGQETTIRALHDIMLVQGMSLVGDGGIEGGAGHHGVCASVPSKEDIFALQRANALIERILMINNR